jgi:hypothetical protein
MASMEKEIVRLHEERALYQEERASFLARLAECEAAHQMRLI